MRLSRTMHLANPRQTDPHTVTYDLTLTRQGRVWFTLRGLWQMLTGRGK